MLIRTEAPADILAIDRLLKSAFDTDAEAQLVMSLRENSRLTLSLVACSDEDEVIGHVMFTPVTLNGEDLNWQGLAPLAVAKAHRGQGIASALIKEGFESLLMFGYPVCVVLGNPDYYQRFGFQPAEQYQMRCPWDVPVGAFQICELAEGMLNNRSGLIEYSPEFTQ